MMDFEKRQKLGFSKNKISIMFQGLSSVIQFMFPIIILFVEVLLSNQNYLTTGTVVAFVTLAQSFISPVTNILNVFIQCIMLRIYFRRVNDILLLPENRNIKTLMTIETVNNVSIKNAYYAYSKFDKNTICNINLGIGKSEKIVIAGMNGSGKSTLLKLIAGLLETKNGEILYNNSNIREIESENMGKLVSFVNQNPTIFNATLKENIILNETNFTEEYFEKVMEISTLDHLIKELPAGLDTHISQTGMNLSGGQKQKIAIARALLKKPQIILFDEATSAMDQISENHIWSRVKELDAMCILVSHNINTIKQFDRIIVLDQGKIVGEGRHNDLLYSCDIYKKLIQ